MRSPVLVAISLIGVLLASACAAPDLGPKPVVKIVGRQQLFTGPVADWPVETWWADYGDPQLTVLIEYGLSNAPTIAVAEARLRRASALAGQASAAQLPSASTSVGFAESKPSYNTGLPTPA